MAMPGENEDGYFKCSILNQNLQNMASKQYTIIAGTMDDNVHFQDAAQITKALIGNGIDFDARVWAFLEIVVHSWASVHEAAFG